MRRMTTIQCHTRTNTGHQEVEGEEVSVAEVAEAVGNLAVEGVDVVNLVVEGVGAVVNLAVERVDVVVNLGVEGVAAAKTLVVEGVVVVEASF